MIQKYIRPNVDFLLTRKCGYCNYICPNCAYMQTKQENASDVTVDAFLGFISTLDKTWQVTLAGGEPLLHPRFFEVLEKLRKEELKVNIITNFSSELDIYKKIVDISGSHLTEFTAAFHSEETEDLQEFAKKALEFDSYKNENTRFKVTSVLSEENAEELKCLAQELNERGITFEAQQLRVNNMLVDYSRDIQACFDKYAAKIPCNLDTFANICDSGYKFLVIDTDGQAYRCHCSRYVRGHILGNICGKDFKLFKKGQPCQLKDCVCPKPIEYGMLNREKESNFKAVFQTFVNLISIPSMVVKNADISIKKYFT